MVMTGRLEGRGIKGLLEGKQALEGKQVGTRVTEEEVDG